MNEHLVLLFSVVKKPFQIHYILDIAYMGAFINGVTHIWTFSDTPPPLAVTLL